MARIRISVAGFACAAGTQGALERALLRLPGVINAYFNPVTDVVYLDVDEAVFVEGDATRMVEAFGASVIRPHA